MACRFTFRFVWLLSALCCFSISAAAADAPWPQWRGPQRDAHSPEKGLNLNWEAAEPKLAWIGEGLGEGYASLSCDGDRLYTTGNKDKGQAVLAVSAANGSVIWETSLTDQVPRHGYEGSRCTPTIDGDRLYVVASSGAIVCLNKADGAVVWRKNFADEWNGKMMSGWGFSESPLVDGDWVLCTPGGPEAMIVALNKQNGEEVWRSAVDDFGGAAGKNGKGLKKGAGYSSIVVSNAAGVKQYVQLVGQGVIGVRASDGKFLWGYDGVANGTANIPTPIPTGDYVFCSTGYNTGSALLHLTKDGEGVKAEEVYFLPGNVMQNKHGGMVLVDGHVYCGHGNGSGIPICVELKTGDVKWGGDKRGPGSGEAAVIYADGHIIYRFQDGTVASVEATPAEMKVKGSFKPAFQQGKSWAHPIIANGRLYLREQDKLMCYDLREST
ncbi:MAG: PQQ-like beta-propeller repeat protein [Planctomycetales bacterium]|nr:PQQ-like beta-propeller repeat protein [Planctomycetales bacterium]